MNINKKLLLFFAIFVSVFALVYLSKPQELTPALVPAALQPAEATISIQFGPDNIVSKNLEIGQDTTAYSLLQELAQSELLELETEQYDFGVFVKAINGNESTAEKAWIYFVNGDSGDIAADQKQIQADDLVEWKYVSPNNE